MTVDKKGRGWRDVLKIHPAADLFPLMSQEELRELADDIKKNGLSEPPSLYQDSKLGLCVLDGRNRLDALELLGRSTIDTGRTVGPTDPYAFVISKNIRRRHLNIEQRQELLIQLIARQPERSDRQIAKTVGVDHKTISIARAKGEDVGRIPHVKVRTDAKGRKQPATKTKAAKPATTNPGKAVAPQDNALSDFNARLMELLRLIGKHQPTRFTKTAVKTDDLARIGKFLSDLAQIKTTVRAKAECAS